VGKDRAWGRSVEAKATQMDSRLTRVRPGERAMQEARRMGAGGGFRALVMRSMGGDGKRRKGTASTAGAASGRHEGVD